MTSVDFASPSAQPTTTERTSRWALASLSLSMLLASLGGAGVSALLYFVLTHPVATLSGYYLQHSLSLGGGANVVNVILVDFRGYDTFGEITVLGLAGLLLYTLSIILVAIIGWGCDGEGQLRGHDVGRPPGRPAPGGCCGAGG